MTEHTRVLDDSETSIHDLLTEMSAKTCNMIEGAINCVSSFDTETANAIIASDPEINRLQHRVEDECVITIARHQPVASDLRDIVSDTHISVELERIADHAVDIVKVAMDMDAPADGQYIDTILAMGGKCVTMLSRVMKAYTDSDEQAARDIAAEDDVIDDMEQQIISNALAHICDDSSTSTSQTQLLWIAHNLERIGDRITNIAERVVFIATGENLDLNRKKAR